MLTDYDFSMEIIVLGQASVGKTKLINRFVKNEYIDEAIPTVGNDYFKTLQKINNTNVLVKFWDTAGQERFASFSTLILKNANAIILVYDITRRDSFNRVSLWLSFVKQNNNHAIKFMLVGNKNDLESEREISVEEAKDFAIQNDMIFFETSAKTNKNKCVDVAINALIEEQLKIMSKENKIRTSMVNGQLVKVSQAIELTDKPNVAKSKSACC